MIQETRIDQIKHVASMIRNSSHVVAFTGAGISTDSGIPDFRSPESGLWANVDPFVVASIYGFKKDPQAFYDWVRPLTDVTIHAQPNAAHMALVTLERLGYLKTVITQNIDMLHTRAGNNDIYELHGHMRTATCIHCYKKYEGDIVLKQFMADNKVPHCPDCSGVIKPDVILFGEQLPVRELNGAKEASRKSDLMIIIGSSLEVAPASELPALANRTGARLVIINIDPTPADRIADVVIHARAAEALPAIVRQLEKLLP